MPQGPLPLPEVVEFDYFDNRKDFSPLGFELNHPIAGEGEEEGVCGVGWGGGVAVHVKTE
mgnify:CR=1 FL=1